MWYTGLELMAVLEEQNIAINGVGNDIFIHGGLFNLCYPQTVSMKKKKRARFQIRV